MSLALILFSLLVSIAGAVGSLGAGKNQRMIGIMGPGAGIAAALAGLVGSLAALITARKDFGPALVHAVRCAIVFHRPFVRLFSYPAFYPVAGFHIICVQGEGSCHRVFLV